MGENCIQSLKIRFFAIFPQFLLKGGGVQKKQYFLGIFPKMGVGHPISQNFCKITKSFLACQIHPKMLKHVLQRWGGDI